MRPGITPRHEDHSRQPHDAPLQCLSLRLEPAALRELQGLLALAQRRLDGEATASMPALIPAEAANVH